MMKVCAGRPFRGTAGTHTRGRRPGLWAPHLEDCVVSESAPAILCGSRARESRETHTREDKRRKRDRHFGIIYILLMPNYLC